MLFYLYILRNEQGQLYVGHTQNIKQRIKDHNSTHGAKFVRDLGAFELVYSEAFPTRSEAMKREKQLKGWTRAKKEALIVGDLNLLKRL